MESQQTPKLFNYLPVVLLVCGGLTLARFGLAGDEPAKRSSRTGDSSSEAQVPTIEPNAISGGAPEMLFTKHVITTDADGAFSVFVADLNGGSYLDVVSVSSNDDELTWYENDQATPPNFIERVIT